MSALLRVFWKRKSRVFCLQKLSIQFSVRYATSGRMTSELGKNKVVKSFSKISKISSVNKGKEELGISELASNSSKFYGLNVGDDEIGRRRRRQVVKSVEKLTLKGKKILPESDLITKLLKNYFYKI